MSTDWHAPLCDLLDRLTEAHEHWLQSCREHTAALRQADARATDRAQQAQQEAMQRIAQLEHERRALIDRAAPTTRADQPTTIETLARQLEPSAAEALRARAARLRAVVEQVQREQAALKLATRSLAAHMQGLIQQVARRLGESGAYGPRSEAAATGALDVTL